MSIVYLDPDKTSALEPFEWEVVGQRGSGISPFAVPYAVQPNGPNFEPRVDSILFAYYGSGTELPEDSPEPPFVPGANVWVSRKFPRITRITFDSPVGKEELALFGRRMEERSPFIQPVAKRFSYLMVGRVLNGFADIIVAYVAASGVTWP